ncbi:MAG: DMT family transporter [Coriobacteriia bacterium]|nr:DMT family transporter [Coriobacteriia bacterium]
MARHILQVRARYMRYAAHRTRSHPRFSTLAPTLALIFVALVWGATFVLQADALREYPLYAFLAVRFGIAALILAILQPRIFAKLSVANVKMGLAAGALLALGYVLQTASLLPADMGGTTPARSAFLTGVYVILVPIFFSIIKKKLPDWGVRVGVVLAVAGLWVLSGLSLSGGGLYDWVLGDTLVLLAALAYTAHMILLSFATEKHSTSTLAVIQLAVIAVVTAFASILTGEVAGMPTGQTVWMALLITGILGSSLAFVVQTWAQKTLAPSRVALIFVLEPVFGGIFGWSVAGIVDVRELIGATLLIGGILSAEIIAARKMDKTGESYQPALEGIPVISKSTKEQAKRRRKLRKRMRRKGAGDDFQI